MIISYFTRQENKKRDGSRRPFCLALFQNKAKIRTRFPMGTMFGFCCFGTPDPREHPRMRGEKVNFTTDDMTWTGSPPHTRGKEDELARADRGVGITPAYAGKSIRRQLPKSAAWDHPRIRGEKFDLSDLFKAILGSPPHTRGKVGDWHNRRVDEGITPAYAGKSPSTFAVLHAAKDHPRIRGEKLTAPFQPQKDLGSPPHTRGKGHGSHAPK